MTSIKFSGPMNQNSDLIQMLTERLELSKIIVQDRLRQVDESIVEDLVASLLRFGGEERGLLQPIVVDENNVLQDGLHRFTAAQRSGWTTIPVYRRNKLSEAEYFEVEFETNFRRTPWSWKEVVQGVVRVHRIRRAEAALRGEVWTQEMTGTLLGGYGPTYVINCLKLFPLLSDPEIEGCDTITDAVKVLLLRKIDEANKRLVGLTLLTPRVGPAPALVSVQTSTGSAVFSSTPCEGCNGTGLVANNCRCGVCAGTGKAKVYDEAGNVLLVVEKELVVNLSQTLFLGDSVIDLLPQWPAACVNHIITDAPYAIDIDNLEALQGIERLKATHIVDENLDLFARMFKEFFRLMKDKGFCIIWCDEENRSILKTHAIAAGFRVQRWSHIWCKTSVCMNGAAQYNETKSTEIALVCAKETTILPHQSPNNFFIFPNSKPAGANSFWKPYEVWEDLLERFTFPGDVLCDPFAGEGSLPLTALQLGRPILACEKDEGRFNQMVENVKAHWRGVNPKVRFV